MHPGAGNWTGTLVNALIHHCGDSLSGIGGVKRPGIVHRLDKETSGVMVVAKTDLAHRALSEAFADQGAAGELERAYSALVWGIPARMTGTVDAPLGRAADRVRRAVVPDDRDDARHAITHYRRAGTIRRRRTDAAQASLVECRLETGRTHQIRVHMAHIGHPVIGDPDYGQAFRTKANRLPEPLQDKVEIGSRARRCMPGFLHFATRHPYRCAVRSADAGGHAEIGRRLSRSLNRRLRKPDSVCSLWRDTLFRLEQMRVFSRFVPI